MPDKEHLLALSNMDIKNIGPDSLKELTDIQINPNIAIEEKIKTFLKQIENPYYFLVNGTPVQITYNNRTQKTLDHCISNYLNERKSSDN